MSNTQEQLKRIQDKLQQLLKQYSALQKENLVVKAEMKKCIQETDIYKKTVEDLKQHVSILKLNTAELSNSDKRDFETRINFYIKEIDRCIGLLGTWTGASNIELNHLYFKRLMYISFEPLESPRV